jgi:NADH dehydrogenase
VASSPAGLVQCNVHFVSDLTAAIGDCDAVVNLAGILNESGKETFERIHAELPGKILEACEYHRINRLLHVGKGFQPAAELITIAPMQSLDMR